MIERDEPVVPEPPPVPASHPAGRGRMREAFELPIRFYTELALGAVMLVIAALVLRRVSPVMAPILAGFGGLIVFLACALRMAKRAIAARKRGRPPIEATVLYWVSLLVPLAGAGWYYRGTQREAAQEQFAEPRRILSDTLAAERAFFREFGRYTYNIKELSVLPADPPRYVLGFPTACSVKFSVEGAKPTWDLLDFPFSKTKRVEVEDAFRNFRRAEDCTDPSRGFEAYVIGAPREGAPLDIWKIDDSRRLTHLPSGP